MIQVHQFRPNPILLGRFGDWSVPSGTRSLYLNVSVPSGHAPEPNSGSIHVHVEMIQIFHTISTQIHSNANSRAYNLTHDARVVVWVDRDAFDSNASTITLDFHAGNSAAAPLLATATVQKEARPAVPINGVAMVDDARGTVTLSWNEGNNANANPTHYQVVIPDPANAANPFYSNPNVAQGRNPGVTITNVLNMRSDVATTHTAQVRHCTVHNHCSAPLNITFTLAPTLSKPEITNVEPVAGRKARIVWNRSVAAGGCRVDYYRVKVAGTRNGYVQDANGIDRFITGSQVDVLLDRYLADAVDDTFQVVASSYSAACPDSQLSDPVKIVDNPLLAPGGKADGDSRAAGSGGQAKLTWPSIRNSSNHKVKYRQILGNHNSTSWNPHLYGTTQEIMTTARTSHTISGLTLGEIYALQLNWDETQAGSMTPIRVFSGRYSYVWPSSRLPNRDERVATYPYFGHWPTKTYRYRICEDTFKDHPVSPFNDIPEWVGVINSAFDEWEEATGNLITAVHDTSVSRNCGLGTVRPSTSLFPLPVLPIWFRPFSTARVNSSVNEIYLVDAPRLAMFHFSAFIDDIQGSCVFFAPACTISKAYGFSTSASTELSDPGNGVDILFNDRHSYFEDKERPKPLAYPADPRFNHCGIAALTSQSDFYGVYFTALHEAGHALGMSGAFVPENVVAPVFDRPAYLRGHPSIRNAVMNYDDQVGSENEEDCSPYPFDLLAIRALYQTVR